MFERFTDRARMVLVGAQEEARLLGHDFIGTEHLLLGLIRDGEGIAARALASFDISLDDARDQIEQIVDFRSSATVTSPPFTPRAKKVLELSLREALQLGHNYIGTEHQLLGLVREGEGVGPQVLVRLGADLGRVRERVFQLMSGYQAGSEAAQGSSSTLDLERIMSRLGGARPIFHSERDAQFALAWQVQTLHRRADIRLEARTSPGVDLDVVIDLNGERTAVELTYWVDRFDGTVDGEEFHLLDQGVEPHARYDYLGRVSRCEEFVRDGHADHAWVIALTNNPGYWEQPREDDAGSPFSLHEGRGLPGQLAWGPGAGGASAGREDPITLRGSYTCTWNPYSTVGTDSGDQQEFRYLGLEI